MNSEPFLILLVEDDPAHTEIVRRNFERFKMPTKLMALSDGQAALDYIFRRNGYSDPAASPRPGIVLLDLRLPKVDGLQVLKSIKDEPSLRQIPVVILTTSANESDIAKAYEYRANSYLVKPVDFAQFSDLLDAFGTYWLTWNQFHQP